MRTVMLVGAALFMLSGCHRAPDAAIRIEGDTSGAAKPDVNPYLAVSTMLVAHGCSNCHAADYARVGPAMTDVATVFAAATPADIARLRKSIIEGSAERWGTAIMPPQHQVTPDQAATMVTTILTANSPATAR